MAELSTGTSTAAHARAAARTVDACKIYGKDQTEVRALDGVTVAFEQSRFTAIMGPSGSGKSTLLHCSAGLDSLSSGRAYIGEVNLAALDDNALTILRREKIGFIFQAYNLVPTLALARRVSQLPQVALASGARVGQAKIEGGVQQVVGVRPQDRLRHLRRPAAARKRERPGP